MTRFKVLKNHCVESGKGMEGAGEEVGNKM